MIPIIVVAVLVLLALATQAGGLCWSGLIHRRDSVSRSRVRH